MDDEKKFKNENMKKKIINESKGTYGNSSSPSLGLSFYNHPTKSFMICNFICLNTAKPRYPVVEIAFTGLPLSLLYFYSFLLLYMQNYTLHIYYT